jgi:E3 ubiquitin-protein ligase ZNRF1/2
MGIVIGSCVPDEEPDTNNRFHRVVYGIKCPVCSKFVIPDDIECHLVMCLTKPRLSYNEDILTDDKGECVICLEELSQGDVIARLPCLCIYHKMCIDQWFEVNRSCPEHPGD